jgi:hypothetical protein
MDILYMLDEIVFISNLMLPKTTLPYRFLLFALSGFGNLPLIWECTMPAEMALDQPPTGGEICIANGQRPQAQSNARSRLSPSIFVTLDCSRVQVRV